MTGLTRNVSEGAAASRDWAQLTIFCLVIMTKTSRFVDHSSHVAKSICHLLWVNHYKSIWMEWCALGGRLEKVLSRASVCCWFNQCFKALLSFICFGIYGGHEVQNQTFHIKDKRFKIRKLEKKKMKKHFLIQRPQNLKLICVHTWLSKRTWG